MGQPKPNIKSYETVSVTLDVDNINQDRSYNIYIGQNIIKDIIEFLPFSTDNRKLFVLTDDNVENAGHLERIKNALAKNSQGIKSKTIPSGEASKSFEMFENVHSWLMDHHVDRHSVLFTLGGGVVGDLGGFVASTCLRGIQYVQIPTTLLSQVDSSVGGKTAIDTKHGKNLVGTFYQPRAVLCDIEMLKTLPRRELVAGYAEVVKYGLINDLALFEWLDEMCGELLNLNSDVLIKAVTKACRKKIEIVEQDETEQGARALLNLGHTFGHVFERAANYSDRLLHGEAIAVGMVLAFQLSNDLKLCTKQDVRRVKEHFVKVGLPTSLYNLNSIIYKKPQWYLDMMQGDKKNRNGQLNLILSRGIGEAFISKNVNQDCVYTVLENSTQQGKE